MPTTDRTTIKASVDALLAGLRQNLVAEPPTVVKPFRRVELGTAGVDDYPRPFLSVQVTRIRPVGVCDNDKLWETGFTLRVVTDVVGNDPLAALLGAVGAVEDHLDGILDAGVIDGAEGLDDRVWTMEYPKLGAGVRVAAASAAQSVVVKVQRAQNRVPA